MNAKIPKRKKIEIAVVKRCVEMGFPTDAAKELLRDPKISRLFFRKRWILVYMKHRHDGDCISMHPAWHKT